MYRYAGYKGYDTSTNASLDKYADKDLISDYAVSAFEWATGCNIITGTSETTLSPDGNAERCQAAAMLRRFTERFSESSKPVTENTLIPAGKGSYSGSSKKPSGEDVSESDKPTSENVAKIKVGSKTAKAGEEVRIDVEVQNNPGILG
ncbi:MAG: hypothetical protein U0M60_16180, partial [Clostridia bacterium]|nr:hypothetical protein [Clostridia bacterium]